MIEGETIDDDLLIEAIPRVGLVAVGMLFFSLAWRLWSVALPGDTITALIMLYVYGTGIGCVVLGAAGVDLQRWGHWIGLWVVLASLAGASWIFLKRPPMFFGTDALLFPRLSAETLLAGQSPYTQTYAASQYPSAFQHATPTATGGYVHHLAYPLGSVLVLVPAAITGEPGTVTLFLVATAGLALTVLVSPARLVPLGILAYLGGRNIVWTAAGGVTDPLWLVPAMVALLYWAARRRTVASAWLGVACAIKQTPWLLLPYLFVWSVVEDGRRATARRLGAGLGVFAAVNLPAIVLSPRAWLEGVFGPLGSHAPLVQQGMGLVWLSVSGVYELPSRFFYALVAVVGLTSMAAYTVAARRSERARWAAWALPAAVLFVHYRSLASYFFTFGVLGYLAALASVGALRWPSWPDWRVLTGGDPG